MAKKTITIKETVINPRSKNNLKLSDTVLDLDGKVTYDYVFLLVQSNMRKRGIPSKFIILSFDGIAEIAAKYQDKCDIWFKFSDKETPSKSLARWIKSTKHISDKFPKFISKLCTSDDMDYIRMAKQTVQKVWYFWIEHEGTKTFIGCGFQRTHLVDEESYDDRRKFHKEYEKELKKIQKWKLSDMDVSDKAKKAKIITQNDGMTEEQSEAIIESRDKIDAKKKWTKKV
jgi:hypothetical protein